VVVGELVVVVIVIVVFVVEDAVLALWMFVQ